MLLTQQAYVISTVMAVIDRARRRVGSRDERGAIPAEVAWIAGIVVIALAVLVILEATTTSKASSIKLQ